MLNKLYGTLANGCATANAIKFLVTLTFIPYLEFKIFLTLFLNSSLLLGTCGEGFIAKSRNV